MKTCEFGLVSTMQVFWEVGKIHSKAVTVTDMGWISYYTAMLDATSLWYCLVFLPYGSVNKCTSGVGKCVENCCGRVEDILYKCGLESFWQENQVNGLSV